MIKLSFKGEDSKKVEHFNNKVTVVTLKPVIIGLNFFDISLDSKILDFIHSHPNIEITGTKMGLALKAQGKATCNEEDEFDPIWGERIAEARAKIRLYKFMTILLYKLMEYHSNMAYGKDSTTLRIVQGKTGFFAYARKFEELVRSERKHLNKLLDL